MTPPALYRYFDSRDDLITALILDAYYALAEALAAARDAASPSYAAARYWRRAWSIATGRWRIRWTTS